VKVDYGKKPPCHPTPENPVFERRRVYTCHLPKTSACDLSRLKNPVRLLLFKIAPDLFQDKLF